MNRDRLAPRSATCCWIGPVLAAVAACAGAKPLPASDIAPAKADATPRVAPSVSASDAAIATADATPRAKPVSAAATASVASASADRKPAFDVPYWPTPQPVIEKILELAEVKSTDVVYDLGCGDARSLVTAAQRYGATGVGVDIDVRIVNLARENVRRHGVEHLVQIKLGDMFSVDLSKADVVFLYLLDRTLEQLRPQLEKMRPGTRIVAHEYPLPGVKPNKTVRFSGPLDGPPGTDEGATQKTHLLYLWKLPLLARPKAARSR